MGHICSRLLFKLTDIFLRHLRMFEVQHFVLDRRVQFLVPVFGRIDSLYALLKVPLLVDPNGAFL